MVDVFPKYTYTKSGTYYFSKTVPRDLKPHYTRNRIIICLKTKSAKKAELLMPISTHSLKLAKSSLRRTIPLKGSLEEVGLCIRIGITD